MDPRAFRDLAIDLVTSQRAGAAYFRAAIGRAYYASFHVASDTLAKLGFPPARNSKGHTQVVRLLAQSGENRLQVVGGLLGDLYTKRLRADYQLDKPDVENLNSGKAAVETSIAIIDDLERFMEDADRKSAACTQLSRCYKSITGK